jgi:hypothetical protein
MLRREPRAQTSDAAGTDHGNSHLCCFIHPSSFPLTLPSPRFGARGFSLSTSSLITHHPSRHSSPITSLVTHHPSRHPSPVTHHPSRHPSLVTHHPSRHSSPLTRHCSSVSHRPHSSSTFPGRHRPRAASHAVRSAP